MGYTVRMETDTNIKPKTSESCLHGDGVKQRHISWLWLLLYPLVIAVTVAGIVLVWSSIPDPIPLHYGADFTVDASVAKSFLSALIFPAIQLFVALAFAGCQMLVQRVPAELLSLPLNRRDPVYLAYSRYFGSAYCLFIGLFTTASVGIDGLITVTGNVTPVLFVCFLLVYIVVIALATYWLFRKLKECEGDEIRA